MAEPLPCDTEIYKNGSVVTMLTEGSSQAIENAVQAASADCGFKIDWHRAAGRAVIKTLGDVEVARTSLDKVLRDL